MKTYKPIYMQILIASLTKCNPTKHGYLPSLHDHTKLAIAVYSVTKFSSHGMLKFRYPRFLMSGFLNEFWFVIFYFPFLSYKQVYLNKNEQSSMYRRK
jgi:hypothetical protein